MRIQKYSISSRVTADLLIKPPFAPCCLLKSNRDSYYRYEYQHLSQRRNIQLAVGKVTLFETTDTDLNPWKKSQPVYEAGSPTSGVHMFLDDLYAAKAALNIDKYCTAHGFTSLDFDGGTQGCGDRFRHNCLLQN
jgi:hypothetical protein